VPPREDIAFQAPIMSRANAIFAVQRDEAFW
jgi:hypothetical protein